jgi:hypothetical protein
MKLDIGHIQITELVKKVKEGKIALPEFQRDFVWKPADVCDLLCSVARQWPIGSFLVLEGEIGMFQLRSLEQAPPLVREPEIVVLDGQQRCTSFFHAFGNASSDVIFYLQFPDDWSEFDDDQIRFEKKTSFVKSYPNVGMMAADRVILISDLHDDVLFEEWKEHLNSKEDRQSAVAFRMSQVPGLKDIAIPVSRLSQDPDLMAIAKIFETINRTGKKLDTFELMVARLYPYEFKLRDKWEEAIAQHPILSPYEDGGLELLKLIALRRYISDQSSGTKSKVKGVKQSDVLALDPDTVKREWEVVVNAYADGLLFLRDRCGVAKPNLLPQPSVPLTIGYFFASDFKKRKGFEKDLERWYWASCFKQSYAQGANTQVLADVKALRAWQNDDSAVPDVISNFVVSDDQLREGRRLNEILVRGILGRQISLGVRDWADISLVADADSIEIHHVFPADVLANMAGGSSIPKDPILNFVAIAGSTNKKIRNEVPGTVVKRTDIESTSIETHGIEIPWLQPAAGESDLELVSRFLRARIEKVRALILAAVKP